MCDSQSFTTRGPTAVTAMSESLRSVGVLGFVANAALALGVLYHAFEGAPQHGGVGGVWLVFQRAQDTAGDRGDVGVAGPTAMAKLSGTSTRYRFGSANDLLAFSVRS